MKYQFIEIEEKASVITKGGSGPIPEYFTANSGFLCPLCDFYG